MVGYVNTKVFLSSKKFDKNKLIKGYTNLVSSFKPLPRDPALQTKGVKFEMHFSGRKCLMKFCCIMGSVG